MSPIYFMSKGGTENYENELMMTVNLGPLALMETSSQVILRSDWRRRLTDFFFHFMERKFYSLSFFSNFKIVLLLKQWI